VQGLIKAYASKTGVYYNSTTGTVYVAGMRGTPTGIQQGLESALAPGLLKNQGRWKAFDETMKKNHPKHVIGHSMGGIIASEYYKLNPMAFKGTDVVTINSPFTPINPPPDAFDNQVHALDPISIFNKRSRVVGDGFGDPHGYSGFTSDTSNTLGWEREAVQDVLTGPILPFLT
jgi:hypothetical protein